MSSSRGKEESSRSQASCRNSKRGGESLRQQLFPDDAEGRMEWGPSLRRPGLTGAPRQRDHGEDQVQQLLEYSGLLGAWTGQRGCQRREGLDARRGAAILLRWENDGLGKMGEKGPDQVGCRVGGGGKTSRDGVPWPRCGFRNSV